MAAEAVAAAAAAAGEVAEAAVAERAGEEAVAEVLAEPVAEGLALEEQGQELVPGPGQEELAAEVAPAAVTPTPSRILTAVHTDRLTAAVSARGCFRFKGIGLVAALSIGSINTRPSLVGMCAGTRHTRAVFSGLTWLSG
jgi:hypothetical protein